MQTPSNDLDTAFPSGDGATKKERLADHIESAASALHERAESLPGGEKIVRAARTAADGMETAADYLREQDVRAMLSDVRQLATRHPGASLLIAAAAGFLLARSLARH